MVLSGPVVGWVGLDLWRLVSRLVSKAEEGQRGPRSGWLVAEGLESDAVTGWGRRSGLRPGGQWGTGACGEGRQDEGQGGEGRGRMRSGSQAGGRATDGVMS